MHQQRLAEIVISKLQSGMDDPCTIINEFLYWDTTTLAFARHRAIKMQDVLRMIKISKSRASGFFNDEVDTEDEHWIFFIEEEDLQLQALNCSLCGNYKYSNTLLDYIIAITVPSGLSFHDMMIQSHLHTIYCKCNN